MTPFLPGISRDLFGRQRRSQLNKLRLQTEFLRRATLNRLCEVFGPWLPVAVLAQNAEGANSRKLSTIQVGSCQSDLLGLFESGLKSRQRLPGDSPQSSSLVGATSSIAAR
jgi:hypothetical protein